MSDAIGSLLALGLRSVAARRPPSLPQIPAPPPLDGSESGVTIRPLPEPPAVPSFGAQSTAGDGSAPARSSPVLLSGSYAATFDVGVACLPCLRGHASTAATAAQQADEAMRQGDVATAKERAVQAAGELVAFRLWDLTPEKWQATRASDRQAIGEALPPLEAVVEAAPLPPEPVLAAYAGVKEAHRFASSPKATGEDHAQVQDRVRPALRWLDEAERIALAPEALAAMPEGRREAARQAGAELREARHALAPEGGGQASPEALELASAHLLRAAVALAPDPTPAQVADMRQRSAAAMAALDGASLGWMRRLANAAPA